MSPASSEDSPPYRDGSVGQSDQGPPRKKMRKGTKSCLECRRRKIKCSFEPGRTQVCNECYARGSTCIDQEHGDIQSYAQAPQENASYSLRERVTQLEDLVRQVLHKLPDKQDGSANRDEGSIRSQLDAQAAEVLKSLKHTAPAAAQEIEESIHLPGGLREDAPALTLFDNAVISRRERPPEISRAQYNKSKALVSALTQLLPSPHDLDIILDSSSRWFTIWRQMFPEITDRRCESIKEAVSHSLRSESPAEIAKVMLCIAISVHQMPSDFDWTRLRLRDDPKELMERYITTIDQLVTSDDEIAATIDGIECMVLEAKYHINMGRPRRAWLLFHRAIAFCQLLGLHRLSNRKPESHNDIQYQRQVSLWCHLFMGDKYLAMILGLPYSVSDAFCAPYIPPVGVNPPNVSEGELYVARMAPLLTKIIDRNQSPVPIPYSATLRIDQDLEELHDQQDPSWWSSERVEGSSIEEHFDRMQAQFFHHQTRALLHMPFMLKSSTDKRYQYSHQAALEASRDMIKYYRVLRSEREVGPYICKLIDFQAFTAAMLLLLNLCGYAQHTRGAIVQQPDLDQDQLDSELIDTTIALLHAGSDEAGGIVAAQSAKALEMLAMVRHGCEDKDCKPDNADGSANPSCQVSIPYFGTITLGMGKHFVPIRKGTYPQPGEVRKASFAAMHAAHTHMATGLPTPPSLCSNSTQQSPTSSTLDYGGTRAFHCSATDYIAPGLGQQQQQQQQHQHQQQASASAYGTGGDDAFVTFDSFMALPPPDFPDCAASNMSGGGTGSAAMTPQTFPATMGAFEPNPMAGFPFGASGNVDLDQGWSWSGDLQW